MTKRSEARDIEDFSEAQGDAGVAPSLVVAAVAGGMPCGGVPARTDTRIRVDVMNGGRAQAVSENIQCYGANRLAADPTEPREPRPAVLRPDFSAHVQTCARTNTPLHAHPHADTDAIQYACISKKTMYVITS